jgi:hypothetical protein
MKADTKKAIKKVGEVFPNIIQIQVEDYCPGSYKIIITNNEPKIEKLK